MESGKSTYAHHLAHVLNCETHSMDRYRMESWQKGVYQSNLREIHAKGEMLKAVRSLKGTCIIECIGTGLFDEQVARVASEIGHRCFRVLINLPAKECIIRHYVRKPPPYPMPKWMSDPEEYIYTTHRKIGDLASVCGHYDAYIHNLPGALSDNLRGILRGFVDWRDKPP
jgi:hypothetical protein